jgi:hypothetical protein
MGPVAMQEEGLEEDRQLPVCDEEDGDGQGCVSLFRPSAGVDVGLALAGRLFRHASVI